MSYELPVEFHQFLTLITMIEGKHMNATAENVAAVSTEELHAGIRANFNNQVDVKEVKFHFKKAKNELGEETKRPTVELSLPVPSIEGIVAILESGNQKAQELLLDAVAEVVYARARDIVNEREDINQQNFPMEELAWEKIASLPKAERRGGGISKETWEKFGADYLEVMPAVTGKDKEKIETAVKILLGKFNTVKTNKPVLKLLKEQLALYISSSPNAEEFVDCVEFLNNKADSLINMDEASLLANL